jgi:hypothetical protein
MDHDAYQSTQPTIALSTNATAELQTSHYSKVVDITKQADKYLHEEYMVSLILFDNTTYSRSIYSALLSNI